MISFGFVAPVYTGRVDLGHGGSNDQSTHETRSMQIKAIRTPAIERHQDLVEVLCEALGDRLQEKDVVCVVSKIVAMEQGRVVKISDVKPSPQARQMERLRYSKDFAFIANAGIDLSNVPDGFAVLWPEKPWEWVKNFREKLRTHWQLEHLGVLMTDSHNTPLRRGVTGLALAYAGFEGVESQVGKPDLYGKPLHITEKAVADDLASAAVLVTGEAGESTPFAVIRGAPITFTHREIDPLEVFINPRVDLYAGIYGEDFKNLLDIPVAPLS